jgi:hypothetical protein
MRTQTIIQSIKRLAMDTKISSPISQDLNQWISDHTNCGNLRVVSSNVKASNPSSFKQTVSLSEMMRKGHGAFRHSSRSSRSMGFFGLQ